MVKSRYHVYVDGSYNGWITEYDNRSAYIKACNSKGLGACQVLVRKQGTKLYIGEKLSQRYNRIGIIY